MLEFLDGFSKRMEFLAITDSITNRKNTSDKIETKWYGKTGLKLSRENWISYGTACFLEGTKVLTSDGLKAIEEINEGDYVLSRNEETGEIEEQIVYHTYNHNPRSCL